MQNLTCDLAWLYKKVGKSKKYEGGWFVSVGGSGH